MTDARQHVESFIAEKASAMSARNKLPILCLDFDGVIHGYQSGWQGAAIVPDPPVPGALRFIQSATARFRVAIYSSRSGQTGGITAMQTWLFGFMLHELEDANDGREICSRIEWPTEKPPALVTIDDRAVTFTGDWPSLDDLAAFQPWNKKPAALRTRSPDSSPVASVAETETRGDAAEKAWRAWERTNEQACTTYLGDFFKAGYRAALRTPPAASGASEEAVARALFEADEDLNDQQEARLRAKGETVAADCLAGPRAQWDDPRNAPILDAFRFRARAVLALFSAQRVTPPAGAGREEELRAALTRFVASFEGVNTELSDEQEAAYFEACTALDRLVLAKTAGAGREGQP